MEEDTETTEPTETDELPSHVLDYQESKQRWSFPTAEEPMLITIPENHEDPSADEDSVDDSPPSDE